MTFYVSDEEQNEMISACLQGERQRECSWCPANHTKGGRCCFGIRHEYNDRTCDTCILTNPCASATHAGAYQEPSRFTRPPQQRSGVRVPINQPIRKVRVGPSSMVQHPSMYGPQQGEPLLPPSPEGPMPIQLNADDSLFVRFMKVSVWGAFEGFFDMGTNFFRRRRPE